MCISQYVSTSTVLNKFTDDINQNLNDKKYVVLLFIDFNPLDAMTPLGVKSYSVRNAMINIKDLFWGR
jgi:hypothetical protein